MSRTATMAMKMMALPGRCAGPSRVVSWETSGCWQLSWGRAAKQNLRIARNSFKYHRETRRGGDASEARMCRRAGEQRRAGDRAHGRPREADADEGPQGQQGTAGARAPRVASSRADDGPSKRRSRAAAGAAAMPARHACADALASSAAPSVCSECDEKRGPKPPDHFRMKAT